MNSTQGPATRQGAISIAENLELRIRGGELKEGDRLPSIRSLAEDVGVSPATVADAYKRLRTRGLIVATRRGTIVAPLPDLTSRPLVLDDLSGRYLADGNPDMRLLPNLGHIDPSVEPLQYGETQNVGELVALARAMFGADSVPAEHLSVVGGSHDGVERALAAHLLPGDKVAVEDPGYAGTHDLIRAMGLVAVPVEIDEEGPLVQSAQEALGSGARALILTSRAQNPTGAALTDSRARDLGLAFDEHPDVLFIEDDHAGPVSGVGFYSTLTEHRQRWMVVRSFGKYLAPDLRVALMAGDSLTINRVQAKQLVGTGWVSQMLQQLVVRGLTDSVCVAALAEAERSYAARRTALVDALAERGVAATARSGFNVWIPVQRETEAWATLAAAGYVTAAGESFRIDSAPALRVTISTMDLEEMDDLADAVARAVG